MLFEFVMKVANALVICVIFFINTIFQLCISSENKIAKFYFNYILYYFLIIFSSFVYLPGLALKPGDLRANGATSPSNKYFFNKVLGIEFSIRNQEELAKDRGAVIVQNHQSSLDMIWTIHVWPIANKVIGISKKDMQYVFPFNLTIYLTGSQFISRNNIHKALEEMKMLGRKIKEKKAKVWIYPEGTRNRNKGTLLPFKKGPFHLAVSAQVPVIPVVTSPYYFLDYEKPSFEKGRVIMQVLDAVPTAGLTKDDVPKLMHTVRTRMWEAYKKLYKEVMPDGPEQNSARNQYISL